MMPTTVVIGITRWTAHAHTTSRCGSPLARAVRINPAQHSSMVEARDARKQGPPAARRAKLPAWWTCAAIPPDRP